MLSTDHIGVVQFNPWKHHMNWLISHVIRAREDVSVRNEMIPIVAGFNNNYIDLYTGVYSPPEIINRIATRIKSEFQQSSIIIPFAESVSYKLVTLDDSSVWVLRKSNSNQSGIHLHPAKFTPHSIRIYGALLKVALLLVIYNKDSQTDIREINSFRTDYLSLSPLKPSYSITKIEKTVAFLEKLIAEQTQ